MLEIAETTNCLMNCDGPCKAVCTNNHMFGRAIWDKLPNCISENFEIFKNHEGIYPKNHPNQTCGYWLITPNQQTFCTETNIF